MLGSRMGGDDDGRLEVMMMDGWDDAGQQDGW